VNRPRISSRHALRTHRIAFPFALRHRAFAAARRRGREAARHWSAVPGVLRRTRSIAWHSRVSPLRLALHLAFNAAAAPNTPARERPALRIPLASMRMAAPLPMATRLLERATLVTRLRELHTLAAAIARPSPMAIDPATPDAQRPQWLQRIVQHMHFPRVLQVVAKAPGAKANPREPASLAPAPEWEARVATRAPIAASAVTASAALLPAELSRITDHVIRQLDRRVLSYRERMGRI
jgi:hypothetical protein